MKIKLTKQSIAALESKKSAYYAVDEAMPGFAVRVTPAGRKTFEVSTREPGQPKASYKKICSVDEMGIQEAKKVAQERKALSLQNIKNLKFRMSSQAPLFSEAVETYIDDMLADAVTKKRKDGDVDKDEDDGKRPDRADWPGTLRDQYSFLCTASKRNRKNKQRRAVAVAEQHVVELGDKHIDEITHDDLDRFFDGYRKLGAQTNNKFAGSSTINKGKSYFSTFFQYWIKKGVVKNNPADGLQGAPTRNSPQSFSIAETEEFRRLCFEGIKNDPENKIYYCMFIFRLCTGLRQKDCLSLLWYRTDDRNYIDAETNEVVLQEDKTSWTRYSEPARAGILGNDFDAIKNYLRHPGTDHVFAQPRQKWDPNAKKPKSRYIGPDLFKKRMSQIFAKLRDQIADENPREWTPARRKAITPRTMRHTVATYLLNKHQLPLAEVSTQLVHASIKTTMKYADRNEDTRKNIKNRTKNLFD